MQLSNLSQVIPCFNHFSKAIYALSLKKFDRRKVIRSNKVFRRPFLVALSVLALSTATYSQQAFKSEGLSATRAQIVLNGVWDFQPITSTKESTPAKNWASIRVPGAWEVNNVWWGEVPGFINPASTSTQINDLKNVSQAWYRQQVLVPAQWKNSAVIIELDRVSTDAQVFINGASAGMIAWYSGTVDITPWVKFGKSNEILIKVVATPNQGEVAQLMGTAESQVTFAKATLATKGITGNVVMYTRPKGEHISDVFVKTSTRKGTIETEVEVSDNTTAGAWLFKSEVVDSRGQVVKTFEKEITLSGVTHQTISFSANWNNPQLWELENPNLYTVKVSMSKNKRLHDTYIQTFGFREFWIEGKNFYLNGTRLNLRPFVGVPGDGMEELVAGGIDGLKKNGFNFSELWPNDFDQRGNIQEWHPIMEVADKKGYLLSGVALPFHNYIVGNTWSYQWDKPGVKEAWEKRMLFELKRQRNHPSVILWGTSANFFGHPQDQDPLHIGRVNWIKGNNFWQRNADAAKEAIATIKKHDVTRPVYTHHGAYVGDIHTLNFYLCLIPLQEREEWMSHYSKFGKIPFIGIEFGTPLHCTCLRGRNGFGNNIQTNLGVTEFAR
jgi:beta-galactosidase